MWLLLQRTAATAWVLAGQLGDHPDPFFAPIATYVSLNTALGERGPNASRFLTGIGAGEPKLLTLEGGYGKPGD